MNFDELWRLELGEKPIVGNDSAEIGSELDDLDEAEVSRFIEWLETSLL